MNDELAGRVVSAMEQMVGAFDQIRANVPAMAGLGMAVANMRTHVHEARMLLAPPEAPAVQAEDPPKIEDIHGELPNAAPNPDDTEPPKPEAPAEKPPEEPPIGGDASAPVTPHMDGAPGPQTEADIASEQTGTSAAPVDPDWQAWHEKHEPQPDHS